MSNLSKEQISEFQQIYKNQFCKEISKEEALEKGTKLLRLMSLIYRPMTKVEFLAVRDKQKTLNQREKGSMKYLDNKFKTI